MWIHHATRPPGILIAGALLPFVFACSQTKPEKTSHRSIPSRYVEGSFVISAESTSTDADIAKLANDAASQSGCKANAPTRVDWGAQADGGVLNKTLANTYNLTFSGCDVSRNGTAALLEKLAGSAGVKQAGAEAIASASPIQENDPDKKQQGHLPFIRRDQACALADKNGPQVIVAVVDTGVDLSHPDLQDSLLKDANGAVIGANFVGSRAQMAADTSFDDQNGHGTHVAGLIAAASNNGIGVVGVAGCANVKIMPVRVMGPDGSGSSLEIDRGIKWAMDHGAQVINLSLGFLTSVGDSSQFDNALMDDAFDKNVMVFAAAGNDGAVHGSDAGNGEKTYGFPASYNHVVAVAATDNQGKLTSFSDRGDRVMIASPGLNDLSTCRGGDYCRMSGTSMATPVAAGAYALALSVARLGLDSSVDRVDVGIGQQMLRSSVLDSAPFSTSDVQAGGAIDAEKLAKAMAAKYPKSGNAPTPPSDPSPPAQPTPPSQPSPPTQPEQPTPPAQPSQPAAFGFAGLTNGQQAGGATSLEVDNLPAGTYAVYFYWGTSPWAFSRVYLDDGATSATDDNQWYFYGSKTLKAVAYSAYGRVLGTAKVQLQGN